MIDQYAFDQKDPVSFYAIIRLNMFILEYCLFLFIRKLANALELLKIKVYVPNIVKAGFINE